jgi:predicted transcriptional regulator
MKHSNVLQLQLDPDLQQAAEGVLGEGETLSNLLESALRAEIRRRSNRRDFLARGLAAGAAARRNGRYVDAKEVLCQLEEMLKKASPDEGTL